LCSGGQQGFEVRELGAAASAARSRGEQVGRLEPGKPLRSATSAIPGAQAVAAQDGGHDLAEFTRGLNASRATYPDLTTLGRCTSGLQGPVQYLHDLQHCHRRWIHGHRSGSRAR